MAKYQLEFSGTASDRFLILDDGEFTSNPYRAADLGAILTDSLVMDIATLVATETGRTLYDVTRVNKLDTIYP